MSDINRVRKEMIRCRRRRRRTINQFQRMANQVFFLSFIDFRTNGIRTSSSIIQSSKTLMFWRIEIVVHIVMVAAISSHYNEIKE